MSLLLDIIIRLIWAAVVFMLWSFGMPAHAYEMLVEVNGSDGRDFYSGPYSYRRVEYREGGGTSFARGYARADFADGGLLAAIESSNDRYASARSVIADGFTLRPSPGYASDQIEIPWSIDVDVRNKIPLNPTDIEAPSLGVFRFRITSSSTENLEVVIPLSELFDGTLASNGRYQTMGVHVVPADAGSITVYEILFIESREGEAGGISLDAYANFSLPADVGFDTLGCFQLDRQVLRDSDADGFNDAIDNCKLLANVDQRDTNGDGIGNLCDGDFDNDGETTALDLAILRSAFFSADADVDMSGDGVVNTADLGLLKRRFGFPPGPSCARPQTP